MALINILQMFYYLIFINIEYPHNIEAFLQLFQFATFDLIPNSAKDSLAPIEEDLDPLPGKFADNEVDALLLSNADNIFVMDCLFLCLCRC